MKTLTYIIYHNTLRSLWLNVIIVILWSWLEKPLKTVQSESKDKAGNLSAIGLGSDRKNTVCRPWFFWENYSETPTSSSSKSFSSDFSCIAPSSSMKINYCVKSKRNLSIILWNKSVLKIWVPQILGNSTLKFQIWTFYCSIQRTRRVSEPSVNSAKLTFTILID